MQQIQDRPQLNLSLVELGDFGLEQGVSLVRLVEVLLEGDGLGLVPLLFELADLPLGVRQG